MLRNCSQKAIYTVLCTSVCHCAPVYNHQKNDWLDEWVMANVRSCARSGDLYWLFRKLMCGYSLIRFCLKWLTLTKFHALQHTLRVILNHWQTMLTKPCSPPWFLECLWLSHNFDMILLSRRSYSKPSTSFISTLLQKLKEADTCVYFWDLIQINTQRFTL